MILKALLQLPYFVASIVAAACFCGLLGVFCLFDGVLKRLLCLAGGLLRGIGRLPCLVRRLLCVCRLLLCAFGGRCAVCLCGAFLRLLAVLFGCVRLLRGLLCLLCRFRSLFVCLGLLFRDRFLFFFLAHLCRTAVLFCLGKFLSLFLGFLPGCRRLLLCGSRLLLCGRCFFLGAATVCCAGARFPCILCAILLLSELAVR